MELSYTEAPRLREMAVHERPQERLERLGASVLSDSELLAMLLRSGSKGFDVISVSKSMIAEAGSLSALMRWSQQDFTKVKGVGKVKALQLLAVMEVAKRVLTQEGAESPLLDTPEKVYKQMIPYAAGLDVEKFWVLCLNRKNRLMRLVEVTSGTATASLVHPREVFRNAIREGAAAIICAHNHPSGDPAPSSADIQITRQLRSAAETIGIDLLDHAIIGSMHADPLGRGYYSFADSGLI